VHPLLIGWEQEGDFSPIVQDRTNEDKGMACDFSGRRRHLFVEE
jgi:hypothetical protein